EAAAGEWRARVRSRPRASLGAPPRPFPGRPRCVARLRCDHHRPAWLGRARGRGAGIF
ncbi:NUBP2 isoform 11, partial [Pan troglodytes]